MMNPWDREQQLQPHKPSNGVAWLVSVVIAVIGLVALAKGGGHRAVVFPIFISVTFMVMFLFSHRRENKRIFKARQDAEVRRQAQAMAASSQAHINKQRDKDLRRVFDRFDLYVIGSLQTSAKPANAVAEILEFARDYVDTNHAIELLKKEQFNELDIHLKAAYQRAFLQMELSKTM
ncbi:MAG: hypothetical protein ACYTDT_01340 [Planctomycetota bacterium]|jgi:hypothetical protein